MRPKRQLTAGQAASIAVAGSLLLYANVWLTMLSRHQQIGHVHGFGNLLWAARLEIARLVLPLAIGMWIMYGGLATFRRGVEYATWSDLALMKLRTQVDRLVWTVAVYTLVLIALGWVVFRGVSILTVSHHGASGPGGLAYFFASPLMCLTQLRQAMVPKRDRVLRVWPGDVKPLVSDHWGERDTSQDIL